MARFPRFKSSDLVATGIAQIKARVDNCNPTALDYFVSVSDELRYGLHVDKTIDENAYEKNKAELYKLTGQFKKNCSCTKT